MKSKKIFFITGLIIFMCVIIGGFLFFKKEPQDGFDEKMEEINGKDWEQTEMSDVEEDEEIMLEILLNDKCGKEEWIDVASEEGQEIKEISGVIATSDAEEESYILEESGKKLIFPKITFGEFLEDRDVMLRVSERDEEFIVHKARCIKLDDDSETEEATVSDEIKETEQLVMIKLAKEINTLAKKEGDWEVVSFLWPNEDYVYVEFSAIESDKGDESEYNDEEFIADDEVESFLLLLKVEENGQEIVTEEIGLLKMDDEDEWIAIRGEDLFDDVDDGRLFDFDVDLGEWIKMY